VCKLITAFSRHEKDKKIYVQDRLREHGDEIWSLLEDGGIVYVCGDAAGMAAGVRSALAEVVKAKGAPDYLDKLAAEGRLRLDVWASS
jgi:sulfite reductase alpha subunit-like flavoprotein